MRWSGAWEWIGGSGAGNESIRLVGLDRLIAFPVFREFIGNLYPELGKVNLRRKAPVTHCERKQDSTW